MIPEDVVGVLMHMNVLVLQDAGAKKINYTNSNVQTEGSIASATTKKLSKKAQGCVLVDGTALKKWLTRTSSRAIAGAEVQVDREAFVDDPAVEARRTDEDEDDGENEDEEMTD